MKQVFLFTALFLSIVLNGQHAKYWQATPASEQILPLSEKAVYQIFKLDIANLQSILQQKTGFITLPLPNGSFHTMPIEETAVMAPVLAARYPNIRSFRAVHTLARLDISPHGFHAMVEHQGRIIYIDPLKNQPDYYISYYADEVNEISETHCTTLPSEALETVIDSKDDIMQTRGAGIDLRVYRLAIACAGEFVQQFGGTVESALATVVSAVNRLNYIYGRDLAVNFQLIANNDQLLFIDPETDPFPATDKILDILSQSVDIFRDSLQLSLDDYDIGHIFVVNCDGANGVAHPSSVCRNSRAGGVTCFTSSNLDAVVTSIFAHEVAHQFAATHTFSTSCNTSQVNKSTEVEPFCGYTIMSYNITDKLPYFHVISLEQMTKLIHFRASEGCGVSLPTNNQNAPNVEIRFSETKTIPKQTPFELSAIAKDADGDSLTYSWEQINNGTPIYRNYMPSNDSIRTFPALPYLLCGIMDTLESLPNLARELTFRCTVRDNHPEAGAIVWKDAKIKVSNTGPFRVLYPNSDTIVWQAGNAVEVRWDVAETRENSQFVNIRLSVDGGYTYPILLAREVVNNGFAIVNLPDIATEQARVRVEASDNIFFNISNQNFTIQAATEPSFIVDAYPRYIEYYCITNPVQFVIDIKPIKGFNELLTLRINGNLPTGTTYEFSKDQVHPLESTILTLFFFKSQEEAVDLQIHITAANGLQKTIDIQFSLLAQDLSTIKLLEPSAQNLYDYNGLFEWTPTLHAIGVDFEIATSPVFDSTVVYRLENISQFNPIRPPMSLEQNRFFYWRVRPVYECGVGKWTMPSIFSTISMCKGYGMEQPERMDNYILDYPVQITDTGTINKVSLGAMLVIFNGIYLQTHFTPRKSLISPSGKTIYLADQYCKIRVNGVYWSFNDLEENAFSCVRVESQLYPTNMRPVEPFSHFAGEPLAGEWRLRVEPYNSLDSVMLDVFNATILLCKNPPPPPHIVRLDTLVLLALQMQTITSNKLKMEDLYHNTRSINYTLITTPQLGKIRRRDHILKVGDAFTQQDINDGIIQYSSESAFTTLDSFHFLAQTQINGILPIQPFYIKIQNETSANKDEKRNPFDVKVFPNPTKDVMNIHLDIISGATGSIHLYNLQGQEVLQKIFTNVMESMQLDTRSLPSGMYFIAVRTAEGMVTKKVSVQR